MPLVVDASGWLGGPVCQQRDGARGPYVVPARRPAGGEPSNRDSAARNSGHGVGSAAVCGQRPASQLVEKIVEKIVERVGRRGLRL